MFDKAKKFKFANFFVVRFFIYIANDKLKSEYGNINYLQYSIYCLRLVLSDVGNNMKINV